jgi:hypothetical protein
MDYDGVGLDCITYDMICYQFRFDMKQFCYCLTQFYGKRKQSILISVSIKSLLILFNLNDKII